MNHRNIEIIEDCPTDDPDANIYDVPEAEVLPTEIEVEVEVPLKGGSMNASNCSSPSVSSVSSNSDLNLDEARTSAFEHSSAQFYNFVRLMQLFPTVHPATIHTVLNMCKGDFFAAVDRLLYAKRCKAMYDSKKQLYYGGIISQNANKCAASACLASGCLQSGLAASVGCSATGNQGVHSHGSGNGNRKASSTISSKVDAVSRKTRKTNSKNVKKLVPSQMLLQMEQKQTEIVEEQVSMEVNQNIVDGSNS